MSLVLAGVRFNDQHGGPNVDSMIVNDAKCSDLNCQSEFSGSQEYLNFMVMDVETQLYYKLPAI